VGEEQTVTPPALWVAWRRAGGGRWYQVGGAGTEAEAWKLIHAAMAAGPRSGAFSSVVLPVGVKP
jgi:hypothetical protein